MKILTYAKGELLTNTYFCIDEASNQTIVIDPGMRPDLIYEKIVEKHLEVKLILLTHGHFDHALGAKYLKEKTNAPVAVHINDAELLSDSSKNSADIYFGGMCAYPEIIPDIAFSDGDTFDLGNETLKVIWSPGHTEGSSMFLSGENLFSGDTLFSDGFGRTDLYGGNENTLIDTINSLKKAGGVYKLYPGHGNSKREYDLSKIRYYW